MRSLPQRLTLPRPTLPRRLSAAAVAAAVTVVAGASLATSPSSSQAASVHNYVVDARTPAQTDAAARAAVKAGGRVVQSWPQIGVLVVQSTRTTFLKSLTAQHNAAVLMAADSRNQPVTGASASGGSVTVTSVGARTGTTRRLGTQIDSLASRQGYLRQTGAIAAQRHTEGNSRVVVGVLDGGVDSTHVDLRANFDASDSVNCTASGRPDTTVGHWTGSAHGTHVAGIIAAAQHGAGIQGVAPHVRIASVKVVDSSDATWPENLVCGFMWSGLRHLTVTNSSFNVHDLWCDQMNLGRANIVAVQRAIAFATGRGVAHVQSAGNDGLDLHSQLGSGCVDPLANRSDVLHVSAVDASSHLLEFSNTGLGLVDIAAPGLDIYSTLPNNRYGLLTGTSEAAPQVSGALALLASEHPGATPRQLMVGLEARSRRATCQRSDYACTARGRFTSYYGAGILDVKAAIVPTGNAQVAPLLSSLR